jgi:hypothetical protein
MVRFAAGGGRLRVTVSRPKAQASAPKTPASPIERCSLCALLSAARAMSSVTSRAQTSAVLKAITLTGCEYSPLRTVLNDAGTVRL